MNSKIYRKRLTGRKITIWLDNISFFQILLIWVSMILLFGVLYHYMDDDNNFLVSNTGDPIVKLSDHIYYSFVTVTTTGFGDIVPKGSFKVLSIIEVVFGLLLFAIAVSKLISIKQDIVLNEVYELSFNERISSVRSAIILFKQNLDKLNSRIEESNLTKRDLNQLHLLYLPAFEYSLTEINSLLDRKDHHFTKKIDSVKVELLLNSTITGFVKTAELIDLLYKKKKVINFDPIKEIILRILPICDSVFDNAKELELVSPDKLHELISHKFLVVGHISKQLNIEHSILNV